MSVPTEVDEKKPAVLRKKISVPAHVRTAVWMRYMGDICQGRCACCGFEKISRANYAVGHVQAESRGGTVHIDNLRPICTACNSAMGSMNMQAFMNKFGFPLKGEQDELCTKMPSVEIAPPEEFSSPLFEFKDHSFLVVKLASWLVQVPTYEANRTIDPQHLKHLIASVKDPQTLQGPFSVVCMCEPDETPDLANIAANHVRVIDGQHRAFILRNALAIESVCDFSVLVRVYPVNEPNEALNIFHQINNSKSISFEDNKIAIHLHSQLDALRKAFPLTRDFCIRPKASRPFISNTNMLGALRRHPVWSKPESLSTDLVFHAQKMNNHYHWHPDCIPDNTSPCIMERARKSHFYLGIDINFQWLDTSFNKRPFELGESLPNAKKQRTSS
jgi:hypothetical protein